jgi:hypothetical protein
VGKDEGPPGEKNEMLLPVARYLRVMASIKILRIIKRWRFLIQGVARRMIRQNITDNKEMALFDTGCCKKDDLSKHYR